MGVVGRGNMGNRATATLFYGYLWDDDESTAAVACRVHGVGEDDYDPGEHSISDWEEIIHARRGGTNPWLSCPNNDKDVDAWQAANAPAITDYFASKRAIKSEFGVDIDYHGYPSIDVDAPHLAIPGTVRRASGLDGITISAGDAAVNPEWKVRLDRWLAEFGIDPPQPEPQWWIVAEYG